MGCRASLWYMLELYQHSADVDEHPGEATMRRFVRPLTYAERPQSPVAYTDPGLFSGTKPGGIQTSQSHCGLLLLTPYSSLSSVLPCGAQIHRSPTNHFPFSGSGFSESSLLSKAWTEMDITQHIWQSLWNYKGHRVLQLCFRWQPQKGLRFLRLGGMPPHPWILSSCYYNSVTLIELFRRPNFSPEAWRS